MAEPDDEVQDWFSDLPYKLKRELAGRIKKEADGLAAAIQAKARVRTGLMRSTVKVRRKRNELDLEVVAGGEATSSQIRKGAGEDYDYTLANEFGTANMAAQPFFYNTAREMMPEIQENIERAVSDILDKA